jgi:hypothetical protein
MRGSSGFVHASFVRVSPVLILRRWSANAAWKARVSNLERAQAWMPERMPGGAALGSPEPTTIRVPSPPPRCAGSGSAVVSSQDFFAVGCCGGSCLTEVAKNSNAPRAPAVPSASLCRLRVGSCLVAGFFRRWPLWRFVSHRSGEKLARSSSIRRPLRLVV